MYWAVRKFFRMQLQFDLGLLNKLIKINVDNKNNNNSRSYQPFSFPPTPWSSYFWRSSWIFRVTRFSFAVRHFVWCSQQIRKARGNVVIWIISIWKSLNLDLINDEYMLLVFVIRISKRWGSSEFVLAEISYALRGWIADFLELSLGGAMIEVPAKQTRTRFPENFSSSPFSTGEGWVT